MSAPTIRLMRLRIEAQSDGASEVEAAVQKASLPQRRGRVSIFSLWHVEASTSDPDGIVFASMFRFNKAKMSPSKSVASVLYDETGRIPEPNNKAPKPDMPLPNSSTIPSPARSLSPTPLHIDLQ